MYHDYRRQKPQTRHKYSNILQLKLIVLDLWTLYLLLHFLCIFIQQHLKINLNHIDNTCIYRSFRNQYINILIRFYKVWSKIAIHHRERTNIREFDNWNINQPTINANFWQDNFIVLCKELRKNNCKRRSTFNRTQSTQDLQNIVTLKNSQHFQYSF